MGIIIPKNLISAVKPSINRKCVSKVFSEIEAATFKPVSAAESKAIAQSLGVVEQSHLAHLLGNLKASMVETFHLGKSAMPEVIALEQKMQNMGVRVTFADNLETAKVITSAIEKIKAKGLKVPERIILFTPNAQNKGMRGWSTPYADVVLFNKDMKPSNKNLLPDFIKNMGIRPNATDTAEGVVFHEIGHRLHGECPNTDEIWRALIGGPFDFALAKEVGYYATSGDKFNAGREFVAEVFAGLMSGKQYSKRVMKIYNALNGPRISGVNMAGVSFSSSSCDIFKPMAKSLSKSSDTTGILSSIFPPPKNSILNIEVQKSGSRTSLSDWISKFA